MPAQICYLIKDGVRRAKVLQRAGRMSVVIDVLTIDDQFVETIDVLIADLRSPKSEIGLSASQSAWYRYKRIESAVFQGLQLPNIEVYQLSGVIPIDQIRLVS